MKLKKKAYIIQPKELGVINKSSAPRENYRYPFIDEITKTPFLSNGRLIQYVMMAQQTKTSMCPYTLIK